jgi:hypothetical protein
MAVRSSPGNRKIAGRLVGCTDSGKTEPMEKA